MKDIGQGTENNRLSLVKIIGLITLGLLICLLVFAIASFKRW